jgi:lipoprotein signal peptidase
MADGARRFVAFAVALGVFALDRWSKWMVETQLSGYDTRTIIPGFFNIVR